MHVAAHALDGTHGLQYQVTAIARRAAGLARGFRRADGIACHLFDRTGHLGHCRGCLLNLVVLLRQAAGTGVGHRIQLLRRRRQLRRRASDQLQGFAQSALHAGHRHQQARGFVAAFGMHIARQIALGDALGHRQGIANRFDDTAGQQYGEQYRQDGSADQQGDDPGYCRAILLGRRQIGVAGLFGIDRDQCRHRVVDLFGQAQRFVGDQSAQRIQLTGIAQAAHATLQLPVLVQQPAIIVVDGLLFGLGDQRLKDATCLVDLCVAFVHQALGVGQGLRVTVDQQAITQRAQAQVEDVHIVQRLDARYVDPFYGGAGLADVAHLHQAENAQADHQQTDDGKAQQRARGGIDVSQRHGQSFS